MNKRKERKQKKGRKKERRKEGRSIAEDEEKGEHVYIIGRYVNFYSYYGRQYRGSSKQINKQTKKSRDAISEYLSKIIEMRILKSAFPCLLHHYF